MPHRRRKNVRQADGSAAAGENPDFRTTRWAVIIYVYRGDKRCSGGEDDGRDCGFQLQFFRVVSMVWYHTITSHLL